MKLRLDTTQAAGAAALPDPIEAAINGQPAADWSLAEGVATIAHELKTPLASILGYSRMLRSGWDSLDASRRDEFFDVVDHQGRRLQRLIEDLLESARIDAGLPVVRREPLDLAGAVRGAVATVTGLAGARMIEVVVPEDDLGLYGDANAIEHVLTNLLENAIKYSPDETLISVTVTERGREVRVSVSDQGSGIDASDLPHVFERFRRGNGVVKGVGLGLHIVRNLVHAHNGRVWVHSDAGAGATFTVALPRRSR